MLIIFGHRKERRRLRRDDGETEEWGERGKEEEDDKHELVAAVESRAEPTRPKWSIVGSFALKGCGALTPCRGGVAAGWKSRALAHRVGGARARRVGVPRDRDSSRGARVAAWHGACRVGVAVGLLSGGAGMVGAVASWGSEEAGRLQRCWVCSGCGVRAAGEQRMRGPAMVQGGAKEKKKKRKLNKAA
ncbi:hypothetical protein EDB85DRAFT_1895054 [Lactarius pseudohatsudake]|nr:hypothetical protein EDB85DRAFT_1895054 [Lactarius pseudohatsudake]